MSTPPPASPTVLTAWTGTLLRALDDRGIDGLALADAVGIAPEVMRDPDRRIPLAQSTRLWHAAVEATGEPSLGLDVSRYVRPGTFHTLGHAVITSLTLQDALERIARFSRVTSDVGVVRIEADEQVVQFVLTWRPGAEPPAVEPVDALLAGIVRTARFMLDRSVAPTAVALERPEPADPTRFDQVFRCPVRFGAADNRLTFDRATAQRPVAGGNQEIARLHDEVTAAYLERLEPSTTSRRVAQVLPDLLPAGEPPLTVVAHALDTSARTLQRLLHDEGTTYRQVLRDVRRELAEDYLRRGDHSITEITYLLGFSETPTFSRAFKQWTGVAPSRFRDG